jgi:hypothetical protein
MFTGQRSNAPLTGVHLVGATCLLAAMAWMTPAFGLRPPTSVDQASASFLHHVLSMANTVFHEAGHWIMAPLGRFLSVLGGSLFQVVIPVVAGVALWRSRSVVGPPFALWWAGQSSTSVATYMADARGGRLMLLGGRTGRDAPDFHDWRNLLEWTGLLEWDVALGWLTHLTGCLAMLAGLAWLGRLCWQGLLTTLAERTGGSSQSP